MCAVKIGRMGKMDLNPRGNLWLKDETKFGFKMLSKMGWNQGKGLGKNEDGISENVKVRLKIGNTGVGFTGNLPVATDTHDYDCFLENLSKLHKKEEIKNKNDVKSLEKRSQQFKNRISYKKFMKAKDVGQYSEKDMNSIFVSKTTKLEEVLPTVKSKITNIDNSPDEIDAKDSTFKSQLNMADYFAQKLKKKSELSQASAVSNDTGGISQEENQSKKLKNEWKSSKKSMKRKLAESESEVKHLDIEADIVNENMINSIKTSKRCKLTKPESVVDLNNTEADVVNDSLVNTNNSNSTRTSKNEKNSETECERQKTSKLEKLKSCLKKRFKLKNTGNYWCEQKAKTVSFNDHVSYKIIDDDLKQVEMDDNEEESDDSDSSEEETESDSSLEENEDAGIETIDSQYEGNTEHASNDNANEVQNSRMQSLNSESDEDSDTNCGVNQVRDELDPSTDLESVVEEKPECFDIPKCDISNYNTWLETQRIAMRMKIYKNMVKKIKKHPVLRKTNMLSIKGYGNWGF